MMAVKWRSREEETMRWHILSTPGRRDTAERIPAERRSDMVDVLVKANADLNTQENVR